MPPGRDTLLQTVGRSRCGSSAIWLTCPVNWSPALSLFWSLVHAAPASQDAPQTVSPSRAGTHTCAPRSTKSGAQDGSDTLRSANVLRGAACFTTALPNPHKKQPPNSTTSSLHQSPGWEVRQHGRLLCAPEVCLSFPKQLPGLIRCLNTKIKKKARGGGPVLDGGGWDTLLQSTPDNRPTGQAAEDICP